MAADDDHFDEELCEELSLELAAQELPLDPSTKDFDERPPTLPAKIASFRWGKKKGRSAVNKFFKDRQYISARRGAGRA